MPDPKPVAEGKPTDDDTRVLLGLYAAERSDSANLMQAGRSIFQTLLAYIAVVAAFGGKGYLDKALFNLVVPAPALGLLIVFTVNSFNLSLRNVSGRTLEALLLRATSQYLPNWTIDSLHRSEEGIPKLEDKELKALHRKRFLAPDRPLREIAIGLGATEHFYNRRHANTLQLWFLHIYTALTAFFVLTGMTILFCYGLHQAFGGAHQAAKWTRAQWSLMWLEIAVFIALVAIFFWTLFSGWKHRRRAEIAASILLGELPAGSRSVPLATKPSEVA
jgi:hypothetical protein